MVKIAYVLLTILIGLTVFTVTPTPKTEAYNNDMYKPIAWLPQPDPELEQFLYYDERKNQSKNKQKIN
jgi:hypothetical protein